MLLVQGPDLENRCAEDGRGPVMRTASASQFPSVLHLGPDPAPFRGPHISPTSLPGRGTSYCRAEPSLHPCTEHIHRAGRRETNFAKSAQKSAKFMFPLQEKCCRVEIKCRIPGHFHYLFMSPAVSDGEKEDCKRNRFCFTHPAKEPPANLWSPPCPRQPAAAMRSRESSQRGGERPPHQAPGACPSPKSRGPAGKGNPA